MSRRSISSSQSPIAALYRDANGKCHYCGVQTRFRKGCDTPTYATVEHILPRSLGGLDKLSNYALACNSCNNRRGNDLMFCRCERCAYIIDNALKSSTVVSKVLYGIVKANKPTIKIHAGKGFSVRMYQGGPRIFFNTFDQAVTFATTLDVNAPVE